MPKNLSFIQNDKNVGTLHEDQHTFLITSRSVPLRIRNYSGQICGENQTHILCSTKLFPK
jgi:hypothetical protein